MESAALTGLRIGVWPHVFRPSYRLADRLRQHFGLSVREIDFKRSGYLDDLDVLVIEQSGLNDYVENNTAYMHEFVARGGVCWLQHQDHERWTPGFLPDPLATPYLVNRYFNTISAQHWSYLMPWPEGAAGHRLFDSPNRIDPASLTYWRIPGDSFGSQRRPGPTRELRTTAVACAVNTGKWEILGGYRDAAVDRGALILQARHGQGLFFWSQILFPEENTPAAAEALAFWDLFCANLLHGFAARSWNTPHPAPEPAQPPAPAVKVNYRMAAHLHSLDWYGADASLGTMHAALCRHGMDIALLSVKDNLACVGSGSIGDYSDDRVFFLPGQEFHPFNWNPEDAGVSHNGYHILACGLQEFTTAFTRSLYTADEIDAYLHQALAYIRAQGGCSCATHPNHPYWRRYPFDAVDIQLQSAEPLQAWQDKLSEHELHKTLSGSMAEQHLLAGHRITLMTSVDMWGIQRLSENPVMQFIYLDGPPSRERILHAIRRGRLIPALHIAEADIRLGTALPGDTLTVAEAEAVQLTLSVRAERPLREWRLFCRDRLMLREKLDAELTVERQISLRGENLAGFLRVELEGPEAVLIANPFFLA